MFTAPGGVEWIPPDEANKPQPLVQGAQPFSFTSDGKRLTDVEVRDGRTWIWTATIESDAAGLRAGKPEPFLEAIQPAFSRDGRLLAYSSNASGGYQVYVRAFPDEGGKWQISSAGGVYPVWSRNGHELVLPFRRQPGYGDHVRRKRPIRLSRASRDYGRTDSSRASSLPVDTASITWS